MRKGRKVIIIATSIVLFIGYLVLALIFDLPIFMNWRSYCSSPVWSQDGKGIFYIKDTVYWELTPGSMFTIAMGGSGRTAKEVCCIISTNQYGWDKKIIVKFITKPGGWEKPAQVLALGAIPNRNEIAFFVRAGEGDETWIYKVNANGANLIKLIGLGKTANIPELFVSSDGAKIAYIKERYSNGVDENLDISGSVFSSWLMDSNGENSHMICDEDSGVVGWTANGKLVISAYADSEGKARIEYGRHGNNIKYPDDVKNRILVYDQTLNKFIENIPTYLNRRMRMEEGLKSLGITICDTSISPDRKKQIFYDDLNRRIIVKDLVDKSETILLRW